MEYAKRGDSIINAHNYKIHSLYSLLDIGEIYEKQNVLDSALDYTKKCLKKSVTDNNKLIEGNALNNLGNIYFKMGNFAAALVNYEAALPVLHSTGDYNNYAESTLGVAKIYTHNQQNDSAIIFAKKAFDIASQNKFLLKSLDASAFLTHLYKSINKSDSAFAYQEIHIALKDSIESREKISKFQNIAFGEQMRLKEMEEEKAAIRNTIKTYILLAGIAICLLIAFLLIRINRIRKKANYVLEKQKNELQVALEQLKNAQSQLIQSEKMASLGELTAGIAHEIQNPLNFVNNFAEVNTELIAEMKDEMDKGNIDEAKTIADDIAENGKKINHHGKRADSIVKGMLQHSRTSTGQKELTDINALADEYLRLSYHGLRAKDKSFNAKIVTDFDTTAPKINIVAQDIGRVLLNLYNNAFYAVNARLNNSLEKERRKEQPGDYEPTVAVTTSVNANSEVILTVKDNGSGIPQKIVDKIFQPFFTTKPTGEGTGLGLSLSYDIMKNAGGEIKVESEEGEGTCFTIRLPAN